MINLYKVTVICKTEWMNEWKKLEWITCSNTEDNAIKNIMDTQDLTGVIIKETKAIVIPENYVVYNTF